MKVVAFDIKSSLGHFRRPDTTATQLTYPFIPPTVAKGMVGAILGIEDFVTSDLVGIQLLSKVEMVSQQLSLLGKGGGTVFNRPTTVQLLVQPAYRIFYAGNEYVNQLEQFLKNNQSVYSTYLGSAYALTKPAYVGTWQLNEVRSFTNTLTSKTVVPVQLIEELVIEDGYSYQRASGFMKNYVGERTFEKSVDFIYEQHGRSLVFKPKLKRNSEIRLLDFEGDLLCLV
ncbi:CRISPR-associated protein Cas5 [Pueribacillus theae]|uniref:CRISPR-associated protein Cas5 n=1 Tax=Pueribacillus theae TaxID=2171751 RepID=A0A2U1K798_9BACI|nr:CRISPR-associated protein Cas5 [Pueribacillus theae]PWA13094.1 CRISPR-associated protein Cas5 [Pueribacillus theae]